MMKDLAKLSTEELESSLERYKDLETEAYQLFTRSAASRCGTYVNQFCEYGHMIRQIKEELRLRKLQQLM